MSKNITFMIMGFACFSKDAIKLLGYASRQGRQCLVTQYQTFKIYVSKSREKLYIRSIYQLLDQKLHSRRYRLCYNIQDDTEQQELCESIEHLRERLQFDSFKITQFDNFTQCILIESLSFLQKVSISGKYCSQANLLQLLTMLPHSVQSFELIRYNFTKKISTKYKRLIKNLKLKKIHGDQFSYVYSLFTVTDTLKVDMKFLNEDNSESKLCQFKCKEIIIETHSLANEKLKALISNVQRSRVFIKCRNLKISSLKDIKWTFKFMKRKQLNQLWEIYTGQYSGVEYRNLEMIFQGALSKCSRKKISTLGLDFMSATVFKDRITEELQLTGKNVIKMVGISLEYCQNLIRLNIDLGMQLKDIFKVKQSKLQEIEIHNCSNDYNFVQELIQKSKRTLLSLTLNQCHNFDLSPIKYSGLINHLSIIKCKNLRKEDSIATLKTLVYLESDQEQILFFSKRIDKLRRITLNLSKVNQKSIQQRQIDTVRSILYQGSVNYEWLNLILQRNPQITDVILPVFDNASQIVKLLGNYQQIQFSFRLFKIKQYLEALTFKQAIQFMKSKENQNSIITNPDHKVYELLSKILIDKQQLYHPYMAALAKSNYEIQENLKAICEHSPTILKQLEHFNDFEKYLSRMDNHHFHYTYQPSKYFEEVFKHQLLKSREEQYIRSIVKSYDEAFNLGGDVEQVVKKIQSMSGTQLNEISTNRERYFELCRKNSRAKT